MRATMGKIQGVIFDWAGTTIDYGSFAPTMVFIDGFRAFGIDITMAEARQPMGKHKRDHIAEVLSMPAVAERWRSVRGRTPTDADIDAVFADFIPRQIEVIAQYSDPIVGVIAMITNLRARGIKIGSCTGYTRAMMDALIPSARAKGYEPDAVVTPDEVPAGRPAPYMIYQNAIQLGVYPLAALVKVGDTPIDIDEGLNAGVWTVGVALTGNAVGLRADEIAALDAETLHTKRQAAQATLSAAGAHYVIDSAAELISIIDDIERRMVQGEQP
ncbi:MAG: phosphonoacetaldehyde hydrolase [Chloroflexota bacterium]|nr:phosphonoacetaldehyde hydrolase [Chloroflexota bacterium]